MKDAIRDNIIFFHVFLCILQRKMYSSEIVRMINKKINAMRQLSINYFFFDFKFLSFSKPNLVIIPLLINFFSMSSCFSESISILNLVGCKCLILHLLLLHILNFLIPVISANFPSIFTTTQYLPFSLPAIFLHIWPTSIL